MLSRFTRRSDGGRFHCLYVRNIHVRVVVVVAAVAAVVVGLL